MENIEVAIRIRPPSTRELENSDLEIWSVVNHETIQISPERYQELMRQKRAIPFQRTQYSFSKIYYGILLNGIKIKIPTFVKIVLYIYIYLREIN